MCQNRGASLSGGPSCRRLRKNDRPRKDSFLRGSPIFSQKVAKRHACPTKIGTLQICKPLLWRWLPFKPPPSKNIGTQPKVGRPPGAAPGDPASGSAGRTPGGAGRGVEALRIRRLPAAFGGSSGAFGGPGKVPVAPVFWCCCFFFLNQKNSV